MMMKKLSSINTRDFKVEHPTTWQCSNGEIYLMNGIGIKRIGWAFDVSSVCSTIANSPINFFFIERECIEIIYCQYYPAIWGVISNTLPFWKTNRMASSRNELENTPLGPQDCHRRSIFQYIPPLSSVLLRYISSPRTILINLVTVDEKRSGVYAVVL